MGGDLVQAFLGPGDERQLAFPVAQTRLMGKYDSLGLWHPAESQIWAISGPQFDRRGRSLGPQGSHRDAMGDVDLSLSTPRPRGFLG